ncbi:MAG TPA: hypothetical protein VFO86_05265, partial [Terriglobia bacterium]|nr:hypothetical protein [Terriglobia bacterium]
MMGAPLDDIVRSADFLREVPRNMLNAGDLILVRTCNSEYSIHVGEAGFFTVSGGWFDLKGRSPARTTIRGCTWGGSVI